MKMNFDQIVDKIIGEGGHDIRKFNIFKNGNSPAPIEVDNSPEGNILESVLSQEINPHLEEGSLKPNQHVTIEMVLPDYKILEENLKKQIKKKEELEEFGPFGKSGERLNQQIDAGIDNIYAGVHKTRESLKYIGNIFQRKNNVSDSSSQQKYHRLNAKKLESHLKKVIKNTYIRKYHLRTEQIEKYANVLYEELGVRDDMLHRTYHIGKKKIGIGFLLGIAVNYILNTDEESKKEYKQNVLKAIELGDLKPGEVVEKNKVNLLRDIKTKMTNYSNDELSLFVGISRAEGGIDTDSMKKKYLVSSFI